MLPALILPFDDLPRLARELEDVQAGVRAIDDVNIAAVVRGDIVRLDHPAANAGIALIRPAPIVRVRGYRRNEERNILRVVRITDVEGAHAGIEVRDEDYLFVEGWPELLIRRVRAKAATPDEPELCGALTIIRQSDCVNAARRNLCEGSGPRER
jgi:hypothetical protein